MTLDADNPRPTQRAFVTLAGREWELTPTHKLTWPETKEAKRLCGMPLVEMEQAIEKADPDAWFAWMYVSIRRKQPSLTERELEQMIGDEPVVAVIASVRREAPEVAADLPPAVAPKPGANDD